MLYDIKCHFCNKHLIRDRIRRKFSYCSTVCFNRSRKGYKNVVKHCVICNSKMFVRPCNIRKTCSYKCRCALMKRLSNTPQRLRIAYKWGKRNLGKKMPQFEKPKVVKVCMFCKHKFLISNGEGKIARAHRRFCSTECWYNYIRDDPRHHPSWVGGYQPYYGGDWQIQSKRARERDRYTCQHCYKYQKRPRLDVHHIVAFRLFSSYKKANRLPNLITLCKSCHSKVPKT